MSINAAGFDFARLMPGFGFLQQAGQPQGAAPAFSQWIAPTLDPQETGRRIQELKTVLFWLEQNVTALKATIQALEVQQLTCQTLQDMNAGIADWAQKMQEAVAGTSDEAPPAQEVAAKQEEDASADPALHTTVEQAGQWWNSLLHTFGQIASHAQQEAVQRQEAFAQSQKEFAASASKKTGSSPAAATRPARPVRKRSATATAAKRRTGKSAASSSSVAKAAPKKPGASGGS
jgi:hypothetical protein